MLASIAALESLRAQRLWLNTEESFLCREATSLAEQLCVQCQVRPVTEALVKRLIAVSLPLASVDATVEDKTVCQSACGVLPACQFGGMDNLLGTTATTSTNVSAASTLADRLALVRERPPHHTRASEMTTVLPSFAAWSQNVLLTETQSRCEALFKQYRGVANALKVIPSLSPTSRQALLDDCQSAIVGRARQTLLTALKRLHAGLRGRPQCGEFIVEWFEGISTIEGFVAQVRDAVDSVIAHIAKICPLAKQLAGEDVVVAYENEIMSSARQVADEIGERVQSAASCDRCAQLLVSSGLTLAVVRQQRPRNQCEALLTSTDTLASPINALRWEALISNEVVRPSLTERLEAFRMSHFGTASYLDGADPVITDSMEDIDTGTETNEKQVDGTCDFGAEATEPVQDSMLMRVEQRREIIMKQKLEYPFLVSSPARGVYLEDIDLNDEPRVRTQLNRLRMERMSFGANSDAVLKQQSELNSLLSDIGREKQVLALQMRQRFPFLPFRVQGVLLSNLNPLLEGDNQFDEFARIYWKLRPEHRTEKGREALSCAQTLALNCPYCVDDATAEESMRLLDELAPDDSVALNQGCEEETRCDDKKKGLLTHAQQPQQFKEHGVVEQESAELFGRARSSLTPTPPSAGATSIRTARPSMLQASANDTLRDRLRNVASLSTNRTATVIETRGSEDGDPQAEKVMRSAQRISARAAERAAHRASGSLSLLPPVASRREQSNQLHGDTCPAQSPATLAQTVPLQRSMSFEQQLTPICVRVTSAHPTGRPLTASRRPLHQLAPLNSLSSTNIHASERIAALPSQSAPPVLPARLRFSEDSMQVQEMRSKQEQDNLCRPYTAEPPTHTFKRTQRRKSSITSPTTSGAPPRPQIEFGSRDSLQRVYSVACQALGLKPNSALIASLPSEPGVFVSTLDLSTNYIGAKGLPPLLYVLEQNGSHLQRLVLRNNRLENSDVAQLTSVLLGESGSELISLDLSHNMISQRGGKCILRLCQSQTTIQTVQLDGTFLLPAFFDCLRDTLSDVTRT